MSRAAHSHAYRDAKIRTLIQFSKFYPTPPTFYSNKFHIHPIEPASANCPTCLRKLSGLPPHLVEPAPPNTRSLPQVRRGEPVCSPFSRFGILFVLGRHVGLPLRETGHPQGDAPTTGTVRSAPTRGCPHIRNSLTRGICALFACATRGHCVTLRVTDTLRCMLAEYALYIGAYLSIIYTMYI